MLNIPDTPTGSVSNPQSSISLYQNPIYHAARQADGNQSTNAILSSWAALDSLPGDTQGVYLISVYLFGQYAAICNNLKDHFMRLQSEISKLSSVSQNFHH